jgi:hypothetical protein
MLWDNAAVIAGVISRQRMLWDNAAVIAGLFLGNECCGTRSSHCRVISRQRMLWDTQQSLPGYFSATNIVDTQQSLPVYFSATNVVGHAAVIAGVFLGNKRCGTRSIHCRCISRQRMLGAPFKPRFWA